MGKVEVVKGFFPSYQMLFLLIAQVSLSSPSALPVYQWEKYIKDTTQFM